jgi:NADH-quinone oxidoreductase subunit H
MIPALINILIFPGILFLTLFGLAAQFVDRKLHARLQNRVGPPWFQPAADLIKLLAKEDIVPAAANRFIFRLMPVLALASVFVAALYIPLWSTRALYAFSGDVIVVFYFLTIPTLTFFLAGWYSNSIFSLLGSVRVLTQFFAYEVPLFLAVLAPALLADSWSLGEMTVFYQVHPWLIPCNIIGFGVALIALLGKLEKVPFDIPEAETEIVSGAFTEYSGRYFAFFRMAVDVEMVVGASLVAAVFLPFGLALHPALGIVLYLIKVLFVVVLITIMRTLFARLRIEQMVNFCWQWLAPAALLQMLVNLFLKGLVLP